MTALIAGLLVLTFAALWWALMSQMMDRASTSTAGKMQVDRREYLERRIGSPAPRPNGLPERRSGHDRRKSIRV